MPNTFHPYVEAEDGTLCGVCGLADHAVAHLPILVTKHDHGFKVAGGGRFATVDEAQAFILEQGDSGRLTSFTGRNIYDHTYRITNLAEQAEAA